MEIGICTGLDEAQALVEAGVDYLEVNVQQFLLPREADKAFAAKRQEADGCPLALRAANCFVPGDLKSTGPDFDPDGICDYASVAFERAAGLGIEHIVFGSGGSRGLPDGFDPGEATDQFVELLTRLGPIAARFGVAIVIEPLRRQECNFINTVDEGAEICRRVDHPSVRLLADIYHMLQNGEAPDALSRHANLLAHTHIAEKADRTCPGISGDDFRPFFAELVKGRYTGRMSIEGKFPNGLAADAPTGVATMRQQLRDAGAA